MAYAEPSNLTGFVEMFQYANNVTDNTFVIMLLLSIYLVPLIYLLMKNHPPEHAMLVAGFVVTVTAVFMRVAEVLTQSLYVFLSVLTLLIAVVYNYIKDAQS